MKREIDARVEEQKAPEQIGEWDWLAFAIGKLGGPRKAAVAIGVPYTAIYEWLENGLATAKFLHVSKLSKLADVPLQYLSRRLGPPDEQFSLKQKTDPQSTVNAITPPSLITRRKPG